MLDLKAYQKTKNIIKLIQEAFTERIERKWLYYVEDLVAITWPEGFEGFKPLRRQRQSIPKRQQQNATKKVVTASTPANSTMPLVNDDIPVR